MAKSVPSKREERRNGVFITFEGGEGVGKSTQATRLAARLKQSGLQVIQTREPGGTPAGEKLRDLFKADLDWTHFSEALLNTAARTEHVEKLITPALAKGQWVVCDRFVDSTIAYQGYLGGVDVDLLTAMQKPAVGDCWPDLTFLFDMTPEEALGRLESRTGKTDKYDRMSIDFHKRLRDAFLDLAVKAADRFVLIDAAPGEDEVERQIWSVLRTRYKQLASDGGV